MPDWNLAQGGTMQMAGLWHRPWYFARGGEGISEAYIRETETVRKIVGELRELDFTAGELGARVVL